MTSSSDIILKYLPKDLSQRLSAYCKDAEELRIRLNRPIQAVYADGGRLTDIITDSETMSFLLERFTEHSAYTYEDEMRQGYITLPCGIRVGLCGNVLTDNGRAVRFRSVTGFCIRFPKEITGCAKDVCRETDGLCGSVLVIAPPSAGKTTLLRDMARELSDTYLKKVCVVDERSEISGNSFFLGLRTDVLDACPKAEGLSIAVRTLSPDVVITDEIGGRGDVEAVLCAIHSGISCAVSIHGDSEDDAEYRCGELLRAVRFTAVIRRTNRGRILLLHDRRENVCKEITI